MDPAIFNDSIKAMRVYQHVGFSTHKSGNILDLILSDIQQTVSVMTTAPGPYLSDHRAVIATPNSKRHEANVLIPRSLQTHGYHPGAAD